MISQLRTKVIEFFSARQEGLAAVVLFGSQVDGSAKEESDVDVALLFSHESKPTGMELWSQRQELAEWLGKEVDLVLLNGASPLLAMQVFKKGEELFVPDRKSYDQFVMTLFTDYADLTLIRQPMIEAMARRNYFTLDPSLNEEPT